MAEHTPGPWTPHIEWDIERARDGIEAFAGDGSTEMESFERVAAAACAAPDLLAALEFIATISDLGDLRNSHEVILLKARAAIAKATGKEA
jgi:16S rRNA G966 N2-methylase RsmD